MSKLVKICLKLWGRGGGGYFKDFLKIYIYAGFFCFFMYFYVFLLLIFFVIAYFYSDRVYDILYLFFIVGVVSVAAAMLIALTDISLTHMFVNIY